MPTEVTLLWSRPRRFQPRGGIFLIVKPNSTGSVGRHRPRWRAWKQGNQPRPFAACAGLYPRVVRRLPCPNASENVYSPRESFGAGGGTRTRNPEGETA